MERKKKLQQCNVCSNAYMLILTSHTEPNNMLMIIKPVMMMSEYHIVSFSFAKAPHSHSQCVSIMYAQQPTTSETF